MTIIKMLDFLGQMGIRWTKTSMDRAAIYITKMAKDERVIEIEEDERIHTLIFFSICEDYNPFYKKKTWDYMPHDPYGSILYIEKAASRKWTKGLRNDIRNLILSKYPALELGKWHRWGKDADRPVTIKRRIYV